MMRCRFFILMLVVLNFTQSCTRSGPPADVIQVQLSSEPVSLDPSLAEDGLSLRIMANLMDGLVGLDSNGAVTQRLADSIEISKDQKTYRFKLRQGLMWSDGVKLKAEDFVIGIQRSLDPKTASKLASLFSFVKREKNGLASVRAEGRDLIIELSEPRGFFLQATVLSLFLPQRQDILDKNQGKWPFIAPVTGPYQIVEHKNEQYYELHANPHYWGSKPAIPKLLFRIVKDEATAFNLYEQGKLDILAKLPAFARETFKKSKELQSEIHTDPFHATYFLAFNVKHPLLKSVTVRRAIASHIKRDEILKTLDSDERSAEGWVSFGLEGYMPELKVLGPQADKTKFARQTLTLGMDASSRNSTIGEKIQRDLKKELGLDLKLKTLDWKSHVKSLSSDTPDIYRFGWLAPFNDPFSHLHAFTSKDPNNYTGWSNAKYDQLVDQIARLSSGSERKKLIEQAQILLVSEEAVVIPIYHYNQTHAVKARVKGFRVSPQGVIRVNELSF